MCDWCEQSSVCDDQCCVWLVWTVQCVCQSVLCVWWSVLCDWCEQSSVWRSVLCVTGVNSPVCVWWSVLCVTVMNSPVCVTTSSVCDCDGSYVRVGPASSLHINPSHCLFLSCCKTRSFSWNYFNQLLLYLIGVRGYFCFVCVWGGGGGGGSDQFQTL